MSEDGYWPQARVQRVTKKRKFKAQQRALSRLGITFEQAIDGEPLVPLGQTPGAVISAPKGGYSNWGVHR